MKKKINFIENIIKEYNDDSNTIVLYSDNNSLHTLLCNKKNDKYCVEIETDVSTSRVYYDMKDKSDVEELYEILELKFN
jgi:hypothetical protein